MVLLPARCPHCGLDWVPEGGILLGEGAMENTFIDIPITCPNCGGRAYFLTGTVSVISGGLELLAGPRWSWELVKSLGLSLKRIVEEDPADPVAAVAKIDDPLSRALGRVTSGWSRADIIALLALLVAILSWQNEQRPQVTNNYFAGSQGPASPDAMQSAVLSALNAAAQNGPPRAFDSD